ncbi:amino acid adenylation domain-containing protein [Sphaerisporangium krabiense]|uniref:Amino acid adenylation domain-containing protein n=1 Tax=Sphaerisporangium krabiense TaxID=763782 RepID=A0A7W8Z741_9ACTN|nr:amino acid adenylation domain-containing protein [Sphaerisporangium krabiense]
MADLAGALAVRLLRHGVGPRATAGEPCAPVGLLANRSPIAYAGYLAIQRLGRPVVPLNPAFPAARTATIARRAGLAAILADPAAEADPVLRTDPAIQAEGAVVPVVVGDTRDGSPGAVAPVGDAGMDDLAYVLFTSGSTGVPKGVPISHRNVAAYLDHVVPLYGAGPGARLSQAFDLTFDPSVLDMFAAWPTGATLVVPGRADLMSPARFVAERGVTHWFSVPSVISLARRLRKLPPGGMPGLRWSLFAGEQLTLAQAEAWRRAAPGARIANLYGPTELTVTCSAHTLPADPARWPHTANGTVPVGDVHPGLDHLVLDAEGRPAAEGELVVRGPQRFPGYLDPADDAGRFVTVDAAGAATAYDGTTPLTPEHWYRTGDRVRATGDGLVHLGRLDQQVQVDGYRVEPGEVEAALRDLPGVRDAVVLALTGDAGRVSLVAAYTGGPPSGDALAALRARLPAYMVPSSATRLDALPLNDNGKIDRRALARTVAGANGGTP